jgi:hypothetical protein
MPQPYDTSAHRRAEQPRAALISSARLKRYELRKQWPTQQRRRRQTQDYAVLRSFLLFLSCPNL